MIDRDRNLLFGIFAVQLGKTTSQALIHAGGAWATDPQKPLSDFLFAQGAMIQKDIRLIQVLVDEAIREHQGDPAVTLADFGGPDQIDQTFHGSLIVTDSGEVRPGTAGGPPASGARDGLDPSDPLPWTASVPPASGRVARGHALKLRQWVSQYEKNRALRIVRRCRRVGIHRSKASISSLSSSG